MKEKNENNQHLEDVVNSPSTFNTEVESHYLSLRGRRLTAALAFITGTGFTLFGYVLVNIQMCGSWNMQMWIAMIKE